jgi:hypothetical protein
VQKINEFPCRHRFFRAFRIAISFDILMDFSISLDIFGRSLGTDFLSISMLSSGLADNAFKIKGFRLKREKE